MSKKTKRLDRIRNNPKDVSFSEICLVLRDHGFHIRSGRGSHRVATHPATGVTITLVKKNPVRRVYVENALAAISAVTS
jgi:predicted RNA binding protein YcfA (HicA-like mRNA interferase family)